MIRNRGRLQTTIAFTICTSVFTSVNVFALENNGADNEIYIENLKNVETKSNSEIKNYEFDEATGMITKYKGSDSVIIVPSEINGVKVKHIGGAFYFKTQLTSVEISEGITSLSSTAFFRCSHLTKVIVPNSLESITGGEMYGCPVAVFYTKSEKVKDLLIKAGVDKNNIKLNEQSLQLEAEDYYSFDASAGKIGTYKGLDKDVIIPSEIKGVKVKSIGVASFLGNSNITSIKIPYGVENIGEGAFHECTSLKEITIPNSVTQIGANIFYGCKSLKSVTIPDSVTNLAKTLQKEDVETFYVESKRVKQLLIDSGRDKSKIIIIDKSGKDATSSQTSANSNSTTTNNNTILPTVDTLQWVKNSDGTWKLLKGALVLTGWQKYDGKWYLMDFNGIMLTGWQKDNEKWYYLYDDGHMASNTVISGYIVGNDGTWIY